MPSLPDQSLCASCLCGVLIKRSLVGVLGSEEVAVLLNKARPLLGQGIVGEDRLDRALRLTGSAVNTLVGVDVVHVLAFVDTFYGADSHTSSILFSDTGLSDNVRHRSLL